MKTRWFYILVLYVVSCGFVSAQTLADSIRVQLLVMSPGEAVYSAIGHAALRLQSPQHEMDYCFTYGMDMRPQSRWRFISGQAPAGYLVAPTREYMKDYLREGRGVTAYELNLTLDEKRRLWRYLDEHVARGLADSYDYLHHGCALVCQQAVHSVIWKSVLRYDSLPEGLAQATQRDRVRRCLTEAPWTDLFWTLIVGTEADTPCQTEQKLVIPADLLYAWQHTTLTDSMGIERPLIVGSPEMLCATSYQPQSSPVTPVRLILVLLLMAILVTFGEWRWGWTLVPCILDILLLTIQSLLGALQTYLLCCSSLVATSWNWLILPYNLLPLMALLFLRHRLKPLLWAAYSVDILMVAFCLASPWIPNATWPHLLLVATFLLRLNNHIYRLYSSKTN